MEQSRWQSPVVWAAIVAQAAALLLTVGVIDTGLSDTINRVAAGILQMLTIFGVLNNPTDREHF
ncbi:hypothetical protein FACS1894196_2310 [Clostridia bacterium]|nr:hypothetical protein FACS1894196_2310 [Clostridia bacterium]